MKRILFYILTFVSLSSAIAQEKHVVVESFETNKWQWDEFYDNSGTASIEDGYLVLKNKNKDNILQSVVELPLNINRNFKLAFKMIIEKVNDDEWFGITYNYDDENNFSCLLIQEKKFVLLNKVNGTISISRKGSIILKSGKNKEVNIEMEIKGSKIIFSVDNMEIISFTKQIVHNTFGCCVLGENTVKVDEVRIEQISEE